MTASKAFVGLGSNAPDAPRRLAAALAALHDAGERIAAVARTVRSPYEIEGGDVDADVAAVLNTVAEIRTARNPRALLDLLRAIEAEQDRDRSQARARTLDLDLLAWGDLRSEEDGVVLPHPRAAKRAFVLAPWEEIAPLAGLAGTRRSVTAHAATLRARYPERFHRLQREEQLPLPAAAGTCEVLDDAAALAAWRADRVGSVGVVPTMGALHAGHESLVRRAVAECDHVLGTLFVNPLQFGPGEDLARYPRTFDADRAALGRAGADAVYAPSPEDLFPPTFATFLAPEGPALGFEGSERPAHFRGVSTVVYKLWTRARPDRIYFGRKDAQQLAVVQRMAADLELPGRIVACPTVRERDGLALSSRNRYLSSTERERARVLSRALEAMSFAAAMGTRPCREAGIALLGDAGLEVDYLDIVDPDRMTPVEVGIDPVLAVGAVRLGGTRLIDNRWLTRGAGPEASA